MADDYDDFRIMFCEILNTTKSPVFYQEDEALILSQILLCCVLTQVQEIHYMLFFFYENAYFHKLLLTLRSHPPSRD